MFGQLSIPVKCKHGECQSSYVYHESDTFALSVHRVCTHTDAQEDTHDDVETVVPVIHRDGRSGSPTTARPLA